MVSIVIRVQNEAVNLAHTLDLIKAQSYLGDVEVIIVDSGSTDNTIEVAKEKGARIISYEKPFSYGGTINEAAKMARGDVLVLLSAHSFPYDRNWLKELVKPLEDSSVAATTSRHVPKREDDPFIRRGVQRHFPARLVYSYPGCSLSLSNASAAYRRSLVLKYPFDEKVKYSEDYIWAENIMRKGYRIVYVPTSAVIHSHSNISSLKRQTAQTTFALESGKQKLRWGLAHFLLRFFAMILYDAPIILRGPKRFQLLKLSIVRRFNIALAWWAVRSGADESSASFWWVLIWPFIRVFELRKSSPKRVG